MECAFHFRFSVFSFIQIAPELTFKYSRCHEGTLFSLTKRQLGNVLWCPFYDHITNIKYHITDCHHPLLFIQ
ncbi:Uncharacterised protein [Vibrio cholerae]|nr:Uncharacterised protein [Vibrio cholerae]CSA04735.1 Uncharacterised protein [Vibrio cholerae]CSA53301.1 Uncharacterised protein [Vibrio cholerae]